MLLKLLRHLKKILNSSLNKVYDYKIAFVGWNPFQLLHVKTLLLSLPNSVFIVEKRVDNNVSFFSTNVLKDVKAQIVIMSQKDMKTLDEKYHVIITQTMFRDIHKIQKAKIVMLQYGYAKEPYNYGEWRALASLCLTYGEYALEKIAPICPTVVTGNPRYDLWQEKKFHEQSMLKYKTYLAFNKKTILYIPTWGELSSFDAYINAIEKLSTTHNVLVKLHHNTDYLELDRVKNIKNKKISYFGGNDDILELLSVSDIVISDYSGAIFDAIYCHKKIVLLDLLDKTILKSKKIDVQSIEFNQRDRLGIRVLSPDTLASTIDNIVEDEVFEVVELNKLRERLFIQTNNVKTHVYNAIVGLMEGKYQKTPKQKEIELKVVTFYNKTSLWKAIRREMINGYLYLLSLRRRYD